MTSLKPIQTQNDADELLESSQGFHDAILKEIKIMNCEYVDETGVCHGDAEGFHFDALFHFQIQRIEDKSNSLQIFFEKVERFNLLPAEKNYSSQIWDARLRVYNGSVYLMLDVDDALPEDWLPENDESQCLTWIRAKKVSWRYIEDGLGPRVEPPFLPITER